MIDCIVIGGGPAGLMASIYIKRSNKNVLVLEKNAFGGQIANSPKVENFPTIKSITGAELVERLLDQALALGVEIDIDEVLEIKKTGNHFHLKTEYNEYDALTVIVCAGCHHRELKAINIENFIDNGVSYCAVCDGSFYENQDVCLVGDGNTALQYALLLANICHKVYVCTLFDRFFGEESNVELLKKHERVEIIHNVLLNKVIGTTKIEALEFLNKENQELITLPVSGLFVAIGQIPNNEIYQDLVDLDKDGYILADEKCLTKTEGLFVAGDCRQKELRQVTTAISDASVAAMQAVTYLLKQEK